MPPAVPIMGNTFCSETVCRPGTMCPDGATCNVEADCEDCAVGSVGLGGDCTACTLDGSVTNKLQSSCEQCFAGKMPHTNRSGCVDCTYNRKSTRKSKCIAAVHALLALNLPVFPDYSSFGYECDSCPLPAVVNVIRTICNNVSRPPNVFFPISA